MNSAKNPISANEERANKIWKYYQWTRVVLIILSIAGLYILCSQR